MHKKFEPFQNLYLTHLGIFRPQLISWIISFLKLTFFLPLINCPTHPMPPFLLHPLADLILVDGFGVDMQISSPLLLLNGKKGVVFGKEKTSSDLLFMKRVDGGVLRLIKLAPLISPLL